MAVREPHIVVREETGWLSESLPLSPGRGWVALSLPLSPGRGWVTFHSRSGCGGEEIKSPPLPRIQPRFSLT